MGFREFQGPQLVLPVLGGALTTVAYLLSGSIVAPILAHVMMHAAAVLHGAATTVQLPPHY
jgi:membrane protease YdiL (CAAX protease family)